MIRSFIKISVLLSFLLGAVGIGLLQIPSAAKAEGITVVPPRFDLFGNPGDTISEKIKIYNGDSADVVYRLDIEDFRAEGDDGSVDLIEPTENNTSYSLARWVTAEPSQVSVPAGQEKIITFTIRIPRNAEPGGHYASVLVRLTGESAPGAASVSSRVGSLILLRVSGDIKEKVDLESFTSNGYQQYGPVDLTVRYKNSGNVHVAPVGTIVISNIFGKKVAEVPVTATNVLPDASRSIKFTWDKKFLVGRYTASYVATYGQQKQTLAGSASFIVFPVYLIFIILGVLLAIYLLITKRKHIRKIINRLTSD